MFRSWSTIGFALIFACPALAQTSPAGPSAANQPAAGAAQISLRQHIADDLEKAGFIDVTVFPASFIAQAQDKQGRSVMMLIGPDETVTVIGWGSMPGKTGTAGGITPPQK